MRGIYVVEAMTLRYEGDDKLSVKRLELRPDNESHRLCLDLRWPQRLVCRVKGYRPAGGGLPSFLKTAAHLLKGIDKTVTHPLSFDLRSTLSGRPRCELLLKSSTTAPFPRLSRVELIRLPRLILEKDAIRVDKDADQSLLKTVYGIVPKEVLVGMLERHLNDALASPKTLKLCQWDLPDPAVQEEKPLVGKLARAAETSWKGIEAEFPVATAQVQRGAGWFRREVSRRAVAARGALSGAPRLVKAEDDNEVAPEWDPANAVSILDVEPVESDEDGDGWRPGPPKESGE